MEKNKLEAWNLLTRNEKQALQLVYGHNKSNLESAVLMKIYPYKFNEILLRAKKFFRLFSEYFEYNDTLLPEDISLEPHFKVYIDTLITSRNSVRKTVAELGIPLMASYQYRARVIDNGLRLLKETGYDDVLEMILTFDQWNGYRILPKHHQKSSPYSRRQNKTFKRILFRLSSMSELSFELLSKSFKVKNPPRVYVPLIGEFFQHGYMVFPVANSKNTLRYLSDNLLLVYDTPERAQEVIDMALEYQTYKHRSAFTGRHFWPKFRKLIHESENIMGLLNIKEFSESSDEMAFVKDIGKF